MATVETLTMVSLEGLESPVWLVPDYTSYPDESCNRFQVAIQDYQDPRLDDLAKGTNDAFRYLLSLCDSGNSEKITDVRLLRSSQLVETLPNGYTGMSIDINKGRSGGKSSLYLIWKTIVINVNPPQYILGYSVVYGNLPSEEPRNAVTTLDNNDDNINMGFGGNYVWVVPEYGSARERARTSFIFIAQDHNNDNYKNLAKGANGKYRYLLPMINRGTKQKIIGLRLLRSSSQILSPPKGYHGMTKDINEGRHGTYLYLIWEGIYAPISTFVSGVRIRYGSKSSDEPEDAMTEISNKGDDINQGFGGRRIPALQRRVSKFLSRTSQIFIMKTLPKVLEEIIVTASQYGMQKSDNEEMTPPPGYNKMSIDINKGRGGTYLYLVWQDRDINVSATEFGLFETSATGSCL
ncbi:hypothetical protein Clacol_006932 [Clathrus columnatus]|uniref:Uncharacterized protein n=1 Tax=Clathrus columnatus TaxID=1419009 RepID=A0AAV5AJ35_9AGAM|nr:hypothetical protein Clacol_006932 [Clathrus columnatus]